jgi:RimJ/RimL family protein N-acetyltransferase
VPDVRPSPSQALSKTLNRVRARGPREVLSLASGRTKEWISSSDDLVMFVRSSAAEQPARDDLTFREATPADGTRYANDIGTDSAATFARRLSDRTHCFFVENGTSILHASWVTTAGAWTRELRSYLVPPAGDAYVYESFTRADARGRGVYPFALASILAWAEATGIERVWVAVEEHNPPSLRAVTKAGFVEAFRLPFSRRFGRLTVGNSTGEMAAAAAGFLSRTPP